MTFLWLVAGFLVGDLLGWWLCPAEVLASCNWNSFTAGPAQTALLMTFPLP